MEISLLNPATNFVQVMQAINERKRTFLEKDEWLTIPWGRHPELKSPSQHVLDILCPVAGLLEDYHTFENARLGVQKYRAECNTLFEKAKRLMIRLFRWRWDWEASQQHPAACEINVDPKTSWTVDEALEPLFPTTLHFQSIAKADQFNLYNTAVTILMSCGHIFSDGRNNIAEAAYTSLPLEIEPTKVNPLTMPHGGQSLYLDGIIEGMRCVDYYLQPKHSSQGSLSLLWPLRMRYYP